MLRYGEPAQGGGLSLLEGPGNDGVSSTAMIASGATVLLFTTGRGTPLGFPVPTIKISSNSAIAAKKPHWIDFNAGTLLARPQPPELDHADRAVLRGFPSKFAHGAASGTVQAVHIHRLVAAPAAASSRDRVGVLVYPTRSGRLCGRPGMRHPGFSVPCPKHLAPLAARRLRFNAGGCPAACAGSIDQPETMREPCARQLRLARFAMRPSRLFPPPRP